jgi:hypothetical protein
MYLCTVLSASFVCAVCFAQTYDQNPAPNPQSSPSSQNWTNSQQNWTNSPQNWSNSPQNWQNTSQDWQNSPQNWQNSNNNYNNANGIYDSHGDRTGYSVPTANGGITYYNNDGSRQGYQPGH